MKIAVLGTGYVGLVSGVCLAARGHRVRCLDLRPEIVESLNAGRPHIHEAGLPELLAGAIQAGRFSAAPASPEHLGDSELVLIAVGTPSAEGRIDLTQIRDAAHLVGRWLAERRDFAAVVVKSTVVPGTTDTAVLPILESVSGKTLAGRGFGLGMNPEFLREGNAVDDFMNPDRIVLGHEDPGTLALLEELYAPWECEKIAVNSRTAEMIKYTNNCLLALQISAANELANVAAAQGGIDFMEVLRGVGADRRWSPIQPDGSRIHPRILTYLVPGCGFGGSCFPKDVEAMRTHAEQLGVPPRLLQSILDVNAHQPAQVGRLLESALPSNGVPRTALLLGLAFKPGTDDLRESASLRIAGDLLERGYRLRVHDPIVRRGQCPPWLSERAEFVSDWMNAIAGSDAVVLCTAWPEYLDLKRHRGALAGRVLFDARHLFHPGDFPEAAAYLTIGHTPSKSFRP